MAEESQHTIRTKPSGARTEVKELCRRGPSVYKATLELQQELFDANLAAKLESRPTTNALIICEHLPTYTMGKSGDEKNMLFKPEAVGAGFHKINRGGDVTFHGPGQIVVYPIFDLDTLHIGVADFVYALEEVIMQTLAHYDITASRLDGAPGIWLDVFNRPRKICAIGLKVSRQCTMHGIALNVNTDLKYFDYIIPCGIAGKGVTSMQKELGCTIDMDEVRNIFVQKLEEKLNIQIAL